MIWTFGTGVYNGFLDSALGLSLVLLGVRTWNKKRKKK
jgi:hypothetical protein